MPLLPLFLSHPLPTVPFSLLLLLSLLTTVAVSKSADHSTECVDLICPLEGQHRLLHGGEADLLSGGGGRKCERCDQCTEDGYSVCVRSIPFNSSSRSVPPPSQCECAHSGPSVRLVGDNGAVADSSASSPRGAVCRLPSLSSSNGRRPTTASKPNAGEGLFRVCYSSALRKLPKPEAKNNFDHKKKGDVPELLVTVQQFWHSDYWRALKPSGLLLYYVFPVAKEINCEGKTIIPNVNDLLWINSGKSKDQVARQKSIWLCKSHLQIALGNDDAPSPSEDPQHPQHQHQTQHDEPLDLEEDDEEDEEEDYGDEEGAEGDVAPEVLFERNVFAGAEKVRLYYEVTVQRENQLKLMPGGKVKFESRKTKVQSDPLDFDLQPDQYRLSSSEQRSGSVGGGGRPHLGPRTDPHHRAAIEQRKSAERPGGHYSRERIVRPVGAARKSPRPEQHLQTTDDAGTTLPIDLTTEVPVPSSWDSSGSSSVLPNPSTTRAGRVESAGALEEADTEDWQLLRNVLLIALLCLVLLVGLAICYKKRLGCFGGAGRGAPRDERNGKEATRSMNGKQYTMAGGAQR